MAWTTILLFSLCGFLQGLDPTASAESQPPTDQQCCENGRNQGLRGLTCTVLPHISDSLSCSIIQEQCCTAAIEDKLCNNSIKLAQGKKACKIMFQRGSPSEIQLSKMCYDCCVLGLTAASKGLDCERQGVGLERRCESTAKLCCKQNTTQDFNVSKCAQLRLRNGTCGCRDGYQLQKDGVNCEDVNECLTHRHNCCSSEVCVNTVGSFRCQRETRCGTGYELMDDNSCKDINECLTHRHNCCSSEVCINTIGSFRCQRKTRCGTGYELMDDNSCKDIDECALGTHDCGPDFLCKNTQGSFHCYPKKKCTDGFIQDASGDCIDVNECLTHRHNCFSSEVCINTVGSFRCQRKTRCGTGYELMDDNSCKDIDECALGTHDCGPDFLCKNKEGSFHCYPKKKCTDGFIQDTLGDCIDINECLAYDSPCKRSQTCINTVGSYVCRRSTVTCARGYHLNEDGARCQDVNECHTGNVCGTHGCVNLMGTYRCECRTGFILNTITKLCEDINECRHYPGRLCTHKCENTEGSYRCSCSIGFKLSSDGRTCDDVDECKANLCSQKCTNVYGSYQCQCRRGYRLSDIDGTTCEDIDECSLPTGGEDVCSYHCTNTPGSFYCSCPSTGYTLAPNGHTCQDTDECAEGIHTCSVSDSCINVRGGFRCLSLKCPANYRKVTLRSRNEQFNMRCVKACQPYDIACARDPVNIITHTFLSLPTFRRLREPEEIAFLRTSVAADPSPLSGATDISFDILDSDDKLSFDVVKNFREGMNIGVVRQVKPIIGPLDLYLEIATDYINSRIIYQRNIVIIHIFISEFSM